jgi:hypothetical protein
LVKREEVVMVKYCPGCGTKLKPGDIFCTSCGAKTDAESTVESKGWAGATVPTSQTPISQQIYPMQPKKSKMKLIMAIIAIIVIIIVIAAVLFIVLGGGSDSRFVGTWTVESMVADGESQYTGGNITFSSDGKYVATGATGTWEIKNSKLYMRSSDEQNPLNDVGYTYEFSNSNSQLTLSFSGVIQGEYHTLVTVLIKT